MNRSLAHLLVCLYPRSWKERYGTEFKKFLETDGGSSLGALADVVCSALYERIFPTRRGGNMNESNRLFGTFMKQPSAFLPLAMSVIALAMVLGYVAKYGGGPVHDEGAVGHLWQLLMAFQMPIIAFFAFKWLPRAPRQALCVLAQHAGAALASLAVVFFFGLG
jgi:hypothetical protein